MRFNRFVPAFAVLIPTEPDLGDEFRQQFFLYFLPLPQGHESFRPMAS